MQRLPRHARQTRQLFVEPFVTAPSPGIVAAALRNDFYPPRSFYLAVSAMARCASNTRRSSTTGSAAADCPDLTWSGICRTRQTAA
jgi:hypothetical protein